MSNATELLMLKQVAAILGVSPKTAAKWARNGLLPTPRVKSGKRQFWVKSDIDKFLEGQKDD